MDLEAFACEVLPAAPGLKREVSMAIIDISK